MTAQDLKLLHSVSRRRKLQLRGQITAHKVHFLAGRITALAQRSPRPIRLNIHSVGGDYRLALELYDVIKSSRAPVFGVVSKAYSGALLVLSACSLRIGRVGSRYVAEPAWHELHVRVNPYTDTKLLSIVTEEHVSRTIQPYVREMWQRAHDILLAKVISAGRTEEELHQLLGSEPRALTETEALRWGFIDVVMYRP